MSYLAFVLDDQSRAEVLKKHPPKFSKVFCHHVTIQFGGKDLGQLKDEFVGVEQIELVGYAADESLECFVAQVKGDRTRRDGKLYHLTHSLDAPRKPVDSNALLAQKIYAKWSPSSFISLSGKIQLLP